MKRVGAFACATAILSGGVASTAKEPRHDAAWVQGQLARFALMAPYHLHARLELVGDDGTTVAGVYERFWASANQWRQEFRIADYRDSEGFVAGRGWSTRSLPYRPWNIRLATLVFRQEVPERAQEARVDFRKISARNGRPDMACIGLRDSWACVDATSGALVLRELTEYRLRQEFSASKQFAGGFWPEEVRLVDEDRVIGRLIVERLDPLPASDQSWLEPPEGAEISVLCKESREAEIVPHSKARPNYPRHLQKTGVSGYVVFQVVIDEEGTVSSLQPLRATHPDFVEPAREAVARWKYRPAMCDGKTRKVQREVSVQFNLKR